MSYPCLQNIIGITRSTQSSVVTALQDDALGAGWYSQTTSGLYLDELEGLISINAIDNSNDAAQTLAGFFSTGRDNAIKLLAEDIMVGLTKRAVNAQKKYTGSIGSKQSSSVMDVSGIPNAGLRLSTTAMKGGVITINTIYTMMSADATFDVQVYMLERGATIAQLVTTIHGIQSLANSLKANTLQTPLTLPLSTYGADYFLLYQPGGFAPRQNGISCGCGYKENILRTYMQVSGATATSTDALLTAQTSSYGMGLALDAEVGCDTRAIVCESYNADESIKIVMAYATRYKAGELVLESILRSDAINRYTLTQRESLYGKRNHFKAEYDSRIAWLVENIDTSLVDCYVCNDKRVGKRGIAV